MKSKRELKKHGRCVRRSNIHIIGDPAGKEKGRKKEWG